MLASKDVKYIRYCDGFFINSNDFKDICEDCYRYAQFYKCNKIIPNIEEITLDRPLLINWTITGKCQNKCVYCYGKDIMHCTDILSIEELDKIISHLKYLNPKVIVISGGEPFLHLQIQYILNKIDFCDIIVDTNGLILPQNFLSYDKNNIHLRISLDSEKEKINGLLRKNPDSHATQKVIGNIIRCIEREIPVSVHTVLSDVNEKMITELGDFLISIGVKLWRILIITPNDMIIDKNNAKEIWIKGAVERIRKYAIQKRKKIKIRLANNGDFCGRGIILLNPEGKYYIRKIKEKEKSIVDENNHKFPMLQTLMDCLDDNAHIERYLYEKIK